MIKSVLSVAAASALAVPSAFAGGLYANVESNASYTGSDFTTRTTDFHIGYEGGTDSFGYYVQGGPAVLAADGVDSESNFSGKLGGSVSATDKLGVYGEVSFAQVEDADNTYGTKIGAKYSF